MANVRPNGMRSGRSKSRLAAVDCNFSPNEHRRLSGEPRIVSLGGRVAETSHRNVPLPLPLPKRSSDCARLRFYSDLIPTRLGLVGRSSESPAHVGSIWRRICIIPALDVVWPLIRTRANCNLRRLSRSGRRAAAATAAPADHTRRLGGSESLYLSCVYLAAATS